MGETAPKVAACGYESPLNPGFGSRAPLNLCDELRRRGRLGRVVSVLPPPADRPAPPTAAPVAAAAPGPNVAAPPPSLRRRLVALSKPLGFPLRYPLHWLRAARTGRRVRAAAAAGETDFLHFYGEHYLPLRRKPPGTRHYLFLDSAFEERVERGHLPASFFRYLNRRMRRGYHQMDHLFPLSRYTRDLLIDHYGVPADRVTAIGSGRGVIQPYHGPKDYANKTVLYAVKAPFADKGGPLLLEAFKLARAQEPELKLWLVGAGNTLGEADRQTPGVTAFGFLPLGQLQDLFNRAALFAMPAPNEPWGLVFLEALSCRTPILALNRRAVPELSGGGKYGFPVDEATPQAVARAILQAVRDPDGLRRMGEEGQRFCLANYSWELAVDRVLEQVDRVAGAGRGPLPTPAADNGVAR